MTAREQKRLTERSSKPKLNMMGLSSSAALPMASSMTLSPLMGRRKTSLPLFVSIIMVIMKPEKSKMNIIMGSVA